MRTSRDMSVAAGLRPAVEGGILPPGPNLRAVHDFSAVHAVSAGQDARLYGRRDAWYVFSAMVGMARRAVPARAVAGGRKLRATLEGIAPLHAARTSQRDVPTTLNAYDACRYNGFTLMEMIGV